MTGFATLPTLSEALSLLFDKISATPPDVEKVSLEHSLGRYCAEDIFSPVDVPSFEKSAVDGYAVLAEDTFGASPNNPVYLVVKGVSHAGVRRMDVPKVSQGEAVEIYTGAPLPEGANAVLMAEYAKRIGENVLEVTRQVHPLQNVSRIGEDFRMNELVVASGTRIRSWHIGALASLNITTIPVYKKIRVGVLSTGSELVEPGTKPSEGQVINSSKPMLKASLEEHGAEPVDLGTVEDDSDLIAAKISEAVDVLDMLIITGGTSVGGKDVVPEAVKKAGDSDIIFHGVRIRPAKPTGAAVVKGKPVFMLSGYPVSAALGFMLFVKPLLERAYGSKASITCTVRGRLTRRVANPALTRTYVRVCVRRTPEGVLVEPLMLTGSGLLSTLTKADGILVVPEGVEGFEEGEEVEVEMLHD
nr:molybdopterin biosynthesis protein MoeA [Candidatus Caldarchaeum subterraneum]BAL55243.1 molybdopterin biosynthesis protein MoeA [uncultured crenarchaeote]